MKNKSSDVKKIFFKTNETKRLASTSSETANFANCEAEKVKVKVLIVNSKNMADKSEPEEQPRFAEGEKILCFHGPLIYEAKIQKVETKDKQTKYFIHYHGWNKNWDEWVPEARMLKHTELNLEKKRDLVKACQARSKKNAGSAVKRKVDSPVPPLPSGSEKEAKVPKVEEPTTPSISAQPPRRAKNKKKEENEPVTTTPAASTKVEDLKPPPDTVETEEQFYSKVEVKIKIPDELKPFLVDDWDYLNRQRKLVNLPSQITVDQVIKDYIKSKSGKRDSHFENAILEVTAGLNEYFNVMLGSQLLYKFEKEQHADILKEYPDTPPCKLYGPIHFLRLFVKLGGMLTYTPLDDKSIQLLLFYIHDFLLYMKKNAQTLFNVQDYGMCDYSKNVRFPLV